MIAITELVHDCGSHLIWSFWPLYVLAIGGNIAVLGFFSILSGFFSLLFHPICGYLVDIVGRKKPIVIGGLLVALSPFLLAIANNWQLLIPGLILRTLDNGLWTSRQTLFADNINQRNRARSYAVFYTIMSLTSSFLPALGGVLLDRKGTIIGFRIGLIIYGSALLIQTFANYKFLKDDSQIFKNSSSKNRSLTSIKDDFFKPLKYNNDLRALLISQSIASFGAGLSSSYLVVYVNNILKMTKTEWGLITSISNLTNTIIRIPLGSTIDKIGRRKGLVLGYFGQMIYPVIFVYSQGFNQILLSNIFNTIGNSLTVTSRESILVDITEQSERGRGLGLFAAIAGNGGVFGSLSPSFGAYLWDQYGPSYPFYVNSIFKLMALSYFYKKFETYD